MTRNDPSAAAAPSPWRQVTIAFPDWARAEHTAVTHLGPLLTTAETNGLVTGWFFVRKRPCWRVRYLPGDDPSPAHEYLTHHLEQLQAAQLVTRATPVVYEPETYAFGGSRAMAVAHRLWHLDSRHLLAYLAATADRPATRRRRELWLLWCSAMLRSAGLDWYEQGDVWARVAHHRHPPEPVDTRHQHTAQARVHRLMSVDPTTLGTTGPADWADAFTTAGRALAQLHADGALHRGLRHVLTHHTIFAANRLGLPATTQARLATTAATVVLGPDPAAEPPPTSAAPTRRQLGTPP